MKFKVHINEEDFFSFQRYVCSGLGTGLKPGENKISKSVLVLWVVAALYFFAAFRFFDNYQFDWISAWSVIIPVIILIAYIILMQVKQSKLTRPEKNGVITGEKTFYLEDDGIREKSDNYESLSKWKAIKYVRSTESHTYIFLDTLVAHIIPHNSFSCEESIQTVVKHINEKCQNSA